MSLSLLAAGARTSIGSTLRETASSFEAGICRFKRAPFVGADGAPYLVAPALEMGRGCEGAARGVALAEAAIADLKRSATSYLGERPIGLVVGIEQRSVPAAAYADADMADLAEAVRDTNLDWLSLPAWVAQHVYDTLGWIADPACAGSFVSDPSCALDALDQAQRWISEGLVEQVLFGAVSAPCDAATLQWLDALELTHAVSRMEGVVPGEAAAFLLLGSETPGLPTLGPGARDPELTAALERVIGDSATCNALWLDENGRVSDTQAWARASMRTLGRRGITVQPKLPARMLGDVGVATLPLYAALAAERGEQALVVLGHTLGQTHGALRLVGTPEPLAPEGLHLDL